MIFWSKDVWHEALPAFPDADVEDKSLDCHALTTWIPKEKICDIHNPNAKLAQVRDKAFLSQNQSVTA
jgi:hypothetical protein